MASFEMSNMSSTTAAPPFQTDVRNSQQPVVEDNAMNVLMQPYSTLDEPIRETIMRDVRAVGLKLKVVMLPLDRQSTLGQLEYIGLKTSSSTVSNNNSNNNNNKSAAGNHEFSIEDGGDDDACEEDDSHYLGDNQKAVLHSLREWDLWGPLFICLALSVLLSLEATPEQASAVFASVFSLVWIGSAIVTVNAQLLGGTISFFQSLCVLGYCVFPMTIAAVLVALLRKTVLRYFWLDCVWVSLGFLWATRASTVFIGQYIAKERRALAVFPVFFFYTFLSWMILLI